MPFSYALLKSCTDRWLSTSPHQPVETVQTPKPTSDTSIFVSLSLRYLIFSLSYWSSLLNYLSRVTIFYRLVPCEFSQAVTPLPEARFTLWDETPGFTSRCKA